MQFIDTHCHIHDSEFLKKYDESQDELVNSAAEHGVTELICVGTDVKSSREAVVFADTRSNVFASVAVHPHEAKEMTHEDCNTAVAALNSLLIDNPCIVAIGECGLDYYYHESQEVRNRQEYLFRLHIELALQYQLPLIFHIREAFDDFFRIVDEYEGVTGVVHSFSASPEELQGVISRGLFVGLNGIMTFSKQKSQLEAAKNVPLEKLVLETDAPFLTPVPFRGKICKPEHIVQTAQFLRELRGESLEELADSTTANAKKLFGI